MWCKGRFPRLDYLEATPLGESNIADIRAAVSCQSRLRFSTRHCRAFFQIALGDFLLACSINALRYKLLGTRPACFRAFPWFMTVPPLCDFRRISCRVENLRFWIICPLFIFIACPKNYFFSSDFGSLLTPISRFYVL